MASARPDARETASSGRPAPGPSGPARWWLIAIIVMGFALRAALVLHAGERVLVDDETGYFDIASNVVNGRGYGVSHPGGSVTPTAARGPAYVFYVAAFYAVAGHRVIPPLVGHCVLDVLSCLLAFWIARRLFRSSRAGLMAAFLYAIYPPFIFNCTQLITETFTNFVLLAAVATFLSYLEHRRIRDLVFCGLAVGLGALNKPPMAPVAALLVLLAVPALGWGRAIRSAVLVSFVSLAVMTPWIARNALVFHEFVPGVTLVGYTFWGGTAPVGGSRMIGSISDPAVPDSLRQRLDKVEGELEQSHWFMQEGLRIIKDDPWRYARLSFRKIFQLWLNVGYDEPPSRVSLAIAAFNLGAFALAAFALRTPPVSPVAARLLVGLWVYWTLSNLPAPVVIRYAMPFYGLLFCYTGAGLSNLARRVGWRERATEAAH